MIKIGQRYMSETEPELGLGSITEIESKIVKISFLGSKTERTYGLRSSPLKRVIFLIGDEVSLHDGSKFIIESVETGRDDLLVYKALDGNLYSEKDLSDVISFNRPEERLFNGTVDPLSLFELRQKTAFHITRIKKSHVRGFVGGRMALLPHQLYVAFQITDRPLPRVLLADEVGLGKTIEAGLALHHLILTERVTRALILVPDSLVYQWFVEMLRKFNLSFTALNQETYLEPETNPFLDNDFVIVNIGLLKGAPIALEMIKKASWDLVVIDEAHQLKWSEEKISVEYKIAEIIAKRSKGLLLLTATPEQLGLEGHFARLKLLDPNRFFSFSQFLKETTHYDEVAKVTRELLAENSDEAQIEIQKLQDLHGTGRIFFRNTRDRLSSVFSFFPKRILHSYALENKGLSLAYGDTSDKDNKDAIELSFKEKLDWLSLFLMEKIGEEKILLIAKSKTQVIELEKKLKERIANLNIGVFHSGLSFIARDRQAAYFADPEGAQILLCTEIGSEGRNFEFAHHLVLFDLPLYPDLLEQRIGRLDRIGQTSDINIHVPYLKNSYEEILFHWYHQGLNAFVHSAKGASLVHQQLQTLLEEYLNRPDLCFNDSSLLQNFLQMVRKEYTEVVKKLEEGRDILVELNSFNFDKANILLNEIQEFDKDSDLPRFMEEVFSELGVDSEELEEDIIYIKPSDNMYIPHFPELTSEGLRITYDRSKARKREDVEFLTWDHPMVVGVMDLIISNTFGNITVVSRKKSGVSKVFIEAYFKLYAIAPKDLMPERYFPPTMLRILVDSTGEDFSEKWSKSDIDERIVMADSETIKKAKLLPKAHLGKVLKMAHDHALNKSVELKNYYKKMMKDKLIAEKERLLSLKEVNPIVRIEEIEAYEFQIQELSKCYENADVALDSLRIIL